MHRFKSHESQTVRVLLLEDSRIDAELINRQIAKLGRPIETVVAKIRRDFLAALQAGPLDLIVADYSLPDIDGLSALKLAQEHAPNTPFVFISGVVGEQFATEAVRAGATDYVTKRDMQRIPMVLRRAVAENEERRERLRAVDALVESESRFRDLADSAPALIWSVNHQGAVVFTSRKFHEDYGCSPGEMEERGWACILDEEDFEAFQREFMDAFTRRRPFRAEVRTRTSTGRERWLRCEAIPRHDGSGIFVGYSGCAVDVTDSKLARETLEAEVAQRTAELREKEEALRQSQKMEAIGQLTGGIAHDFNNMLAGILGSADLLRRHLARGRLDKSEKYIDAVMSSANRAAALTQRMLAFSRRQSLDVKPTRIDALVLSLEDMLRRTLKESIRLQLDLKPDAGPAMTDANQLESAILNLAINARDAMADGGTLTICVGNRSVDPALAERKGIAAGDYVALYVRDTGTGMSHAVQEKAFDPFFTTKPIGQGTGLGLSSVFGLARQLGGVAGIQSVEGEGTTVEILMPRAQEHDLAPAAVETVNSASTNGKGTILVVEDEAVVQMLMVDTLNEWGFETIESRDADSALKIVESDIHLDLMITDVGLPGMDGRALADVTRKHRPRLKILFATGYAEGARTRSGFLGAGMDLIAKPFDMAEFERKVKAMVVEG